MTIACQICGLECTSKLPPNKAQSDVLAQMSTHLGAAHPQEAAELATNIAATSTYLLIRDYVNIPPAETELQKSFELNEQSLFEILGVDPQPQD